MSIGIVVSASLVVVATVVIGRLELHSDAGAIRRISHDVGVQRARSPLGSEVRFTRLGPNDVGRRSWRPWMIHRFRFGNARMGRRFDREVANLASSIAREMRAGRSLVESLERAGSRCGPQMGEDIAGVLREAAGGNDLRDAMNDWVVRRGSKELGAIVAIISLGIETGGQMAESFDLAATGIRRQLELRDEITSLTAQSRASAVLLTGLPVFAASGLALLNPASGTFLLSSAAGRACVGAAVVLDVLAWTWMRTLMRVSP